MGVVIFHYHLNPGGVTRIIESQISSLKIVDPKVSIRILCGHCPDIEKYKKLGASVIIDDNLNYLDDNLSKVELDKKLEYILRFFKTHAAPTDILHMHNLNLGKNPLMTLSGYKLSSEGYKIVNHVHDFAEDRPANWKFLQTVIENKYQENLTSVLYPNIRNYHFATLTLFDLHRLQDYDINCKRKHLLPNPVNLGPVRSDISKTNARKEIIKQLTLQNEKKIITYPVRVIQRKNIGEFILLSQLFADDAHWLVTQPPKNPKEIVKYNDWKDFCKENQINIFFEVGVTMDFETLLAGSDACVTTSIREGFGMVYLEPWLCGTPVIGRELDHVINEFKMQGLTFPFLYNALYVNYNGQISDFKDLKVEEQKKSIQWTKNQNYRDEIFSLNPNLKNFLNVISDEIISNNKKIIHKYYSLEKFGERLYGIYQKFSG